MILCVTGTQHQPFDRLVEAVDQLSENRIIIQRGHYPKPLGRSGGRPFYPKNELEELARKARLIITHAGPGSIWLAFRNGKIPIVVPRQAAHGEHVDDHQVAFTKHLVSERRVIAVFDIARLPDTVTRFDRLTKGCVPPSRSGPRAARQVRRVLNEWLAP